MNPNAHSTRTARTSTNPAILISHTIIAGRIAVPIKIIISGKIIGLPATYYFDLQLKNPHTCVTRRGAKEVGASLPSAPSATP